MQTIALEVLGVKDGACVLDVGCGRGRHTHAAFMFADVMSVGVDLGLEDLRATHDGFTDTLNAQTGFGVIAADARALPFDDATFDHIICSEVLEHIPDYIATIKEIMRVVKPRGTIAISVPHRWTERICWLLSKDYHNTIGGHIRIFNADELEEDFALHNWRLYKKHYAHGLHTPYWWLRCLLGVNNDKPFLVRAYKKFLEWEIMDNPILLRPFSRLADKIMGKSVVLYFRK